MASLPANSKALNFALFSSLLWISMVNLSVSSHQFQVGGEKGWVKPAGNKTKSYNAWAAGNRFRVGDTLLFKSKKDSVLVVHSADYKSCNLSNPISKFQGGGAVFQLDRPGFFYFVSGQPGHCNSGQKLIIRVMHHSGIEPPASAPSPTAGGGTGGGSGGGEGWDSDNWGPPRLSSTNKLVVASYFTTALEGVFVILYLFL
ncbi:hypothetical protein RJ639_024328 [Escallonia herrerae]|uniref:Phytocyanin domain-containing protein n=1 Tax=Escallonia herrerae TaxID=1293975 RepID=A0AA89AEB7_9ASTE|nr:hypothetical protein RJ639_024328 [Escallonia herrerae]